MNGFSIGYVFIPGGGMSSWLWRDLIQYIDVPYIAIDSRLKVNTASNRKEALTSDCVDHIVERIEEANLEKVILVGHSIAGLLAALVAKQIPEKIAHIIYIAANIPKNGTAAIDTLPLEQRAEIEIGIRMTVDYDYIPHKAMEERMRTLFCNTCSEEIIEYVLEQNFSSEPLNLLFEKVSWDGFPDLPQTYIRLLKDRTVSPELQTEIMKHLNVQDSVEIESDHLVMLSHPKELGEVLRKIRMNY